MNTINQTRPNSTLSHRSDKAPQPKVFTVRQILRSLTHDLGKTVVAVTHDSAFAAAADRRIGLVDGRIQAGWQPS